MQQFASPADQIACNQPRSTSDPSTARQVELDLYLAARRKLRNFSRPAAPNSAAGTERLSVPESLVWGTGWSWATYPECAFISSPDDKGVSFLGSSVEDMPSTHPPVPCPSISTERQEGRATLFDDTDMVHTLSTQLNADGVRGKE